MKKVIPLIVVFIFSLFFNAFAAYLNNVPVSVKQPSGEIIHCFASGDEYFNWLHDANNFTIIKDKTTGYYAYAIIKDGQLIASEHLVGSVNPESVGIDPGLKIIPDRFSLKSGMIDDVSYAPKTGDYNNIVLFIRFADQAEFTEELSVYEEQFNGQNYSLRGYFSEVSGSQLDVYSTFYPISESSSIVSYQDAQPRNYYVPYDYVTNPIGYVDDAERTEREHTLLESAINSVKPDLETSGINFDSDADGYVDNICFIVQGTTEGWSELLWPHKWALYSKTVTISGARVWEYNFQLSAVTDVSVLCHEMFHTLGAPDLYHYSDESSNLYPVAGWDLMAWDYAQHMLTWMKYQYGNWFNEIPEITEGGTYKLPAVGNSSFACYKIPVQESTTEFFMVEYRKKVGYDTHLSASYDEGLLVYRVNTSVTSGNRNGPPDELYVLRPGVTDESPNGSWTDAAFSADQGRILINADSDPVALLSDGSNTSLSIYDIGFVGDSIEFKVGSPESGYTLTCNDVTIVDGVITSCSYDFSNTDIIIPDTLCDQPVIGLGYRLFRFKNVMTSVQLPATLQTIAESVFEHNNLSSVDFSRCTNLTYIGPLAFMANNLTSINLPENLTYLGGGVFNGNNITQLNGQLFDGFMYALTDGTELISYTMNTTNVTIPAHVQKLGDHALNTCGLTRVDLSLCIGLTEIGFRTFFANEIPSIDLSTCSSLQTIGNSGFLYSGLDTIDLNMCKKLTFIGGAAFSSNNFSSFYLPTPELNGMEFENWTDGNQNIYQGGALTTALDVWYQANFNQSELLPLELTLTTTDAYCYGDHGILSIQIEGGLGGTYGIGGNIPEAENDSNSYVVVLIPEGGSAANSIVLDDNQNETSIMVEAGSYTVLVEDAAGNEIENLAVIMEPEPLELIVDLFSFLCPGDTVMNLELLAFGGTEPYQYIINKNGVLYADFTENSEQSLIGEGVYNLVVVDANGCMAEETFVLELAPPVNFSLSNVTCYGEQSGTVLIRMEGEPGDSYQVSYAQYSNDSLIDRRSTAFFESEILITGLEFDINPNYDIMYVFTISNSAGCLIDEFVKIFEPVGEELVFSYEVLEVRELDADIQIAIQGGVAPYQVFLDGMEIQNLQQTVSTGYHSIQLIDAHMCVLDETIFIEPNIACPQHFYPVWEGNPNDAMNIFIIEAKVDGIDLEEGDELGVFDGDLCVGYGKILHTINHQNILSIVVSTDDGTGNGFTPGHEVSYRVWSCSKELEYKVDEINCFDNQLNGVNCLAFQSGASSYVQLGVSTEVCWGIDFQTDWNIFSSPVLSDSADMQFNFQELINTNILLKIQDETGASLEDRGIFGGWQNDIGDILPDEGYKIKLNSNDSIQICGRKVGYPYAIHLNTGWNIVGYPALQSADGMEVVASLIENGTLLKVQDEQGRSIENLGIFGGWQNYIGNFYPGKGYKVKVSTYDTLWVSETYSKSAVLLPGTTAPVHFKPVFEGNGVDHMNFNFVNLQSGIVRVGDELAVFDGDNCVGVLTLLPGHIKTNVVSIPASAADNKGMSGFLEGNTYSFRLWQSAQQAELEIIPEVVKGDHVFVKHESVILNFKTVSFTGLNDVFNTNAVDCYPNPFNQEITVDIHLATDAMVEVLVMNQTGQCIKRLVERHKFKQGTQNLIWTGRNEGGQPVSTGIYYLRITINDQIYNRKIVYNK
ncbi:M6 family metalloprotease domain-containing protein [uncultured Draconibacterium sp.]|uniref:M6 family metalloprotease domain-containing protein n=1 Tax=uncultured Draconibacterium sp. TaxID=1573823 RepID=UPI003216FFC2